MTLQSGRRLGPYEIVAPLGAGGMGEVYRARDTRLGREVAIKVLPVSVSSDAERLRRFEREARSASSLNHPNIVIVHDVGNEGETSFIAMELVEGRTLRELLADGPLQTKKLLSMAAQVADGLAKAHQAGIVHRDLKPENVMVTRGGVAKILDFGLSKLAQAEVSEERQTRAPTQSLATEPGVVVGTVEYMSPEQTLGEPLDVRSDQFSFGSVLYEMATGTSPFRKRTRPETMTAILREEPEPLATAAPSVPVPLHWIVERCLAKEREERYASTEDLARDLARLRAHASGSASSGGSPAAERVSGGIRLRPVLFAGAVLGALILGVALGVLRGRPLTTARRRFQASLNPPAGKTFEAAIGIAVSPDGTRVAFGTEDGQLWLRDLSTSSARELPGSAGGHDPFWSADGRSLGFFAGGKLRVVDLSSMSSRVVCDAPSARGGAWNADGTIVFAPESKGVLFRVTAAGGDLEPVTTLDPSRREESHRYPTFLPDGRHFLFVSWHLGAGPENLPWILVGSLDSRKIKPIVRAFSSPAYSPAGYLLYAAKDRTLVAQSFDTRSLSTARQPFPVVDQIVLAGATVAPPVATATADPRILVYRSGTAASSRLAWLDPDGKELGIVGPAGDYGSVRLSPDSRRAAVEVTSPRNGEAEIWIFDLSKETASPWNPDSGYNLTPVWSPDGSQIVFASYRKGDANLYVGRLDGAAPVQLLLESADNKQPVDWSPDGRWIMYTDFDKKTGMDLWLLPMFGDHRPRPFLKTEFGEAAARFSPDGRWVAYVSNPSGQLEVYVTPFGESGERVQVSTHGGSEPRWSKDGREIFFAADGKTMSAAFHAGPPLVVEAPVVRFAVTGEPSPDYQRFLSVIRDKDFIPPSLTVVLDWLAGLK